MTEIPIITDNDIEIYQHLQSFDGGLISAFCKYKGRKHLFESIDYDWKTDIMTFGIFYIPDHLLDDVESFKEEDLTLVAKLIDYP